MDVGGIIHEKVLSDKASCRKICNLILFLQNKNTTCVCVTINICLWSMNNRIDRSLDLPQKKEFVRD